MTKRNVLAYLTQTDGRQKYPFLCIEHKEEISMAELQGVLSGSLVKHIDLCRQKSPGAVIANNSLSTSCIVLFPKSLKNNKEAWTYQHASVGLSIVENETCNLMRMHSAFRPFHE
ncbi:uncharacterized protein LOC111518806 [Drosophila willistoni]|uniref:uncharacterized protein LOC111518806 n=1 Tax=Drosophila willistoni TaxID=7260 RepID=UPI000C26D890|nr:uncharacterized protein LOC111518806 [Drosophila willistoni]